MHIELSVVHLDPPVGSACRSGAATVEARIPFDGWLGLLAALQRLLCDDDEATYAAADDAGS